jgi:soluble lytic murein transglycosylase
MHSIFTAIMRESDRFHFDPVLLLSIIKVESGFVVNRRGRHGEIGLMQIKPSTGRWVAKKLALPWGGKKTLENPELNIRIGAAYLALLRDLFPKQEQLYLSAYNMGAYNVFRSVRKNVIPRDYASRILEQYQNYYSKIRYNKA